MKYRYAILDPDHTTVFAMQSTLNENENYSCVGIANTEEEALDLILKNRPKLVFLNPKSKNKEGIHTQFSLLSELTKYLNILPKFIIVSNSEVYAIEGIRNNVLDYLLKPLDKGLLKKAIYRFEKAVEENGDNTLCYKSYGDYRFIDLDEILYLKADNNTTDFMMCNGSKIEAFKTLKHFQNLLPKSFVRIHNSYIINTNYVSRIHFGKAKCSIKNSNALVPFSKSYKDNVEEIKDQLAEKSLIHF